MEVRTPPVTELGQSQINIRLYNRSAIEQSRHELALLYSDLNARAFAQDPISPQGASEKLDEADVLFIAEDEGIPIGFATYQLIPSSEGTVIYQARGITPGGRRAGLGKRFAVMGAQTLKADYLIAKAQNPNSIWSTMSSGLFERSAPVDMSFDEDPALMKVLKTVVEKRGKTGQVDMRTGMHRGSYPMGQLGDYTVDLSHPGIARVEAALRNAGLDRSRGDAVYYGGRIIIR